MYCIYTDCDVPREQGNWDHVFPLALGGKNQFVVWSDERSNKVLGSQIEGVLARDSLLAFALRDSGVKGHGTNSPGPRWNKVTIDGRPFQVTWAKEKVVIWDSINRREVEDMEVIGRRDDSHTPNRSVRGLALPREGSLGRGILPLWKRIQTCGRLWPIASACVQ